MENELISFSFFIKAKAAKSSQEASSKSLIKRGFRAGKIRASRSEPINDQVNSFKHWKAKYSASVYSHSSLATADLTLSTSVKEQLTDYPRLCKQLEARVNR